MDKLTKVTQTDIDEIDKLLEEPEEPEENEDICPKTESGEHVIDWNTLHVSDDVERYIDVNCLECGRSGCLGSAKNLEADIQW